MAAAAPGASVVPGWCCGKPCSRCSWTRCWKVSLLTILSLVLAQILVHLNGSSFYDARPWSTLSSFTLRLQWFSKYSAQESPQPMTIDALGLDRRSDTEDQREAGGSNGHPEAATVQAEEGGDTPTSDGTHRDNNSSCPANSTNTWRLHVNKNPPSLEEQEAAHPELTLGGHYHPKNATPRHRVAIIIPYRHRERHLAAFVHHMHPFLQRQQLEYNIYVVEQAGDDLFNRGMLMNAGVLEAAKQYAFDCLFLHDVDLVPEDDRNLYTCLHSPRHMSVAISTFDYRLPYQNYFGGVCAMTARQYKAINGFSNEFWGWGGEDDDLYNRVRSRGFVASRVSLCPGELGRYTMLSHKKEIPSPDRFAKLRQGKERFKTDGLNSIKYQVLKTERRRLFTLWFVALART